MRIAFFTPLAPVQSGISEYSEDLLPYLSEHADIDVFIDDYEPEAALKERFRVYPHGEFEKRHSDDAYDIALYHMGNNPYHFYMYPYLLKYPGITVMHDFVLHHFFTALTLAKGDTEGYVEEFRYNNGETGERVARLRLKGVWTEIENFVFPLNKRVIDSSLGVIVHSGYVREEIEGTNPRVPVRRINMGIPALPQSSATKQEMKRRMGIPYDALVVGSFGFVTPIKKVDVSLRAFKDISERFPKAVFLIVGEISGSCGVVELIDALGLKDRVIVTGFVTNDGFKEYINATDLAINLRYPTAGETSASLLRIMGAGVPVITSNYKQFAEFPDDSCVKIDMGEGEVVRLREAIEALASSVSLMKSMGDRAREYVARECTLQGAALAYSEFVLDLLKRKAVRGVMGGITRELSEIGAQGEKDAGYLMAAKEELGLYD